MSAYGLSRDFMARFNELGYQPFNAAATHARKPDTVDQSSVKSRMKALATRVNTNSGVAYACGPAAQCKEIRREMALAN